jgi:AcrR family transcriptional regulator
LSEQRRRRGREATTAEILQAAEELFYERGYGDVSVRDIAERVGVSHALVHQYVGSKEEIFRAVLSRNARLMAAGATQDLDLLASASAILRRGLERPGRDYARLLMGTALSGLPYDQTTGQFFEVDRLIELIERQAAAASPEERSGEDLHPRLVGAFVGSLFLGWVAGESWLRPAWGLGEVDDTEIADGLERVILSILRDHVPGVAREAAAATDVRELEAELEELHAEITALRELLKDRKEQGAEESA